MSAVDKFLRNIWLECCGHLSAFRYRGGEFGKARKVSSLPIGSTLLYEYDFSSTTEIQVSVIGETMRPAQREKVRLLARNVPMEEVCEDCGAPAEWVNVFDEYSLLCDECADGEEDGLLPITNSPRCGECGYTGEFDKWAFEPAEK